MEYAVQDIKVSKTLVQAEANARAPKTVFYAVFLSRIRFPYVITNCFYACLGFCIYYSISEETLMSFEAF